MIFRTTAASAVLLMGSIGWGEFAWAQYYPPPAPSAPGLYYDDDGPFYDGSAVRSRPLPPPPDVTGAQPVVPVPPANIRYGRAVPVDADDEIDLLPPSRNYVAPYLPSSQPGAPISQPSAVPGTGAALPPEWDAVRPPMMIGPGQAGQAPTDRAGGEVRFAALPPDLRPESGFKELPARFRRTMVEYKTKEPPGTLIVDTQNTYLYLVLEKGKAMRYGIGVGREGFTWAGTERVSRMAEWPDWHPPEEMIQRQPYLPRFMAGGPGNPLGARALYLGSTVYRIHGTNQPSTIGTFVSSGCIRLTNEDATDLYSRVKVGTGVVVLPGKAPPGPSVMQVGSAPPPASARANAPSSPGELRPAAAINGAPPSPAR